VQRRAKKYDFEETPIDALLRYVWFIEFPMADTNMVSGMIFYNSLILIVLSTV
jgi:hypothetical protein